MSVPPKSRYQICEHGNKVWRNECEQCGISPPSTGRMSRADAQAILRALQPAIWEFLSPDAPPATSMEALACEHLRSVHQQVLDSGASPDAAAIRALRTRVAALQAERFFLSTATAPRVTVFLSAPRVTAAAVVTLYGMSDNLPIAAGLAADHLNVRPDSVRLQDSSHVRTATLTGTRYIFTSHTP